MLEADRASGELNFDSYNFNTLILVVEGDDTEEKNTNGVTDVCSRSLIW